jgi:hypothetical protein
MKGKETWPSWPGLPLGTGKTIGDLFTTEELKRLTRLAAGDGVTIPALIRCRQADSDRARLYATVLD